MGHALNNTLQDVLARFERMRGRDVLWQPGTDHAGIATQMVVERQLMERQEPGRRALGREKFLEKVWAWKAELGGTITTQLKRLGASCDWSRERFTMDEGLSRAVLKVFVELYRDGLIYKDKRLVNWDPKLLTAISDLEVQQVEVKGHLWHFKYPVEGLADTFITVATTRPETMLGDTAVAVHPDDKRYERLVGKNAILPLVGRRIPIVADEYSDPEKGTGAVKITPAHDFNDFEVGRRHNLPQVNVLDVEANLSLAGNEAFLRDLPGSPELEETLAYHGLDRFVVRKEIVARMEAAGLLAKIEQHTHMVPHGDRSGVVIEPFLTDQWYVDAKTLAQPAIAAVRDGRTVFVPRNWEATYFNWMENIQPWCVSRQLWWGHQIPAWYGFTADEQGAVLIGSGQQFKSVVETFVAVSEQEAIAQARKYYGADDVVVVANDREALEKVYAPQQGGKPSKFAIWRDEDVLDTWFSSALWPFSTLGLAGRDHGARALLPDRCAGDRLRHHLLLGRAHDDDGPPFHGGGAVPHRLHPRPGARRARRQDVEVERQRHRSAAPDRRLWCRRAALHARGHGGSGSRHQARHPARGRLPQFRDQAVERLPLRRDEQLRDRPGLRSDIGAGDAQPLDRARDREGPARDHRRRSRPTSSTMRRVPSIVSCGTCSAIGTSNWQSRCCKAPMGRPRTKRGR